MIHPKSSVNSEVVRFIPEIGLRSFDFGYVYVHVLLSIRSRDEPCVRVYPSLTVALRRSRMYSPARIGGYFEGFSSDTQLGRVWDKY
jgi:hypothetical protein